MKDNKYIVITKICILALILPVCLAIPAVHANPASESESVPDASVNEPMRKYLQAYESMRMAEWLRQQDMLEESEEIYREALGLFKKLARNYPGWQTELVAFRVQHCEQELSTLRADPAPATSAPAGTPPHTPHAVAAPAQPLPAQPARPSATLDAARNTARLRRAVQLEKITDLRGALKLYQEILDSAPRHLQALQGAARIYLQINQTSHARTMLDRAAQLPENDEGTLLLRAMMFCHDGEFQQARRLLEVILKRNPWNPHAHLVMGVVFAGTGMPAEAEESTKRAITLNPRLGDAYYNLAQISLRQSPVNLAVTRAHYHNALKYGAVPDPSLAALLE